jgi:hypothetical protein
MQQPVRLARGGGVLVVELNDARRSTEQLVVRLRW